jgi:hypothetical protein
VDHDLVTLNRGGIALEASAGEAGDHVAGGVKNPRVTGAHQGFALPGPSDNTLQVSAYRGKREDLRVGNPDDVKGLTAMPNQSGVSHLEAREGTGRHDSLARTSGPGSLEERNHDPEASDPPKREKSADQPVQEIAARSGLTPAGGDDAGRRNRCAHALARLLLKPLKRRGAFKVDRGSL